MRLRYPFLLATALLLLHAACGSSDSLPPDDGSGDAGGGDASSSDGASSLDGTVGPGPDASDLDASDLDAGPDASDLDAGPDASDLDAGTDASDLDAGTDASAGDAEAGPSAEPLILFRGGGVAGALGGRAGADAVCETARVDLEIPRSKAVAFISVNADDEIRDLPATKGLPVDVPIIGPTGLVIADDWADLLDGSIARTLQEAEVFADTPFWYSGSDANGALAATTCTGWTDPSTLFGGAYGINYTTGAGWIAKGQATCGLTSYVVLCVGY